MQEEKNRCWDCAAEQRKKEPREPTSKVTWQFGLTIEMQSQGTTELNFPLISWEENDDAKIC